MAQELKLYLPLILQDIAEYEALSTAETPFVNELEARVESIVTDSFLSTMSEPRLAEWEKALGIPHSTYSLEQRRSIVVSRFRGTGKLNKSLIRAMVKAFTGGDALVTFANGVIKIRLTPPASTFVDFSMADVFAEISKRKPAHILMTMELAYVTWEQFRDTNPSWEYVRDNFADWEAVSLYYTNQEA